MLRHFIKNENVTFQADMNHQVERIHGRKGDFFKYNYLNISLPLSTLLTFFTFLCFERCLEGFVVLNPLTKQWFSSTVDGEWSEPR